MATQPVQAWWDKVPARVGGDVIIANVGADARNVAVGKNITQTVYDVLGEPSPDDRQLISERFADLAQHINQNAQLELATASAVKLQLKLLEGELAKTGEDEAPNANTISLIGDWLLDTVPQIAEALASLFATPAVGRVVGKAGDLAVAWVKSRFGGRGARTQTA